MNLIVEKMTSIEQWFLYQSLNFRMKCINMDMMKAIIILKATWPKSLLVYQWWYHLHLSLSWIVVVKLNLRLWIVISIYHALVLGEHIGLRQFYPKFGGVCLMDNFKGMKQQHTQQINKMFYVFKTKKGKEEFK